MTQTIIVFGATGGIGEAITLGLSKHAPNSLNLVVHYGGNHTKAEALKSQIIADGNTPLLVQGDVGNDEAMTQIFDTVIETFGQINHVINTAGIMRLAPIKDYDLATFDEMVHINLRGTFVISQLAAQHLSDGGSLINFSTTITRASLPTYGAYAATKGGVEALTLILARELRGRHIRVNTIAPGPIATDLFFQGKTAEQIETSSKITPMERLGEPSDIAHATTHLVFHDTWTNGQTLFINGGMA